MRLFVSFFYKNHGRAMLYVRRKGIHKSKKDMHRDAVHPCNSYFIKYRRND